MTPPASWIASARRTVTVLALALVLVTGFAGAASSKIVKGSRRAPARAAVGPVFGRGLVWHVETMDGRPIDSRLPDEAINPASVTKMATSLWALETLGPAHRFTTRVLTRGSETPVNGELPGDLVIEGGGDPDFQAENAMLIAQELNARGIQRVHGLLVVNHSFWMGWEDGSQGRERDPEKRALVMGARLRQALDPQRWNGLLRRSWYELAAKRGFNPARPPRVVVGGATVELENVTGTPLIVHVSRPLLDTLHRLNAYSINDIERVGANIGTPADFTKFLTQRWNLSPGALSFETTSGLGTNRISPRQIVMLVRDLRLTTERLGIPLGSVLATVGCDPGTVAAFFGKIANGPAATSVVGKTGTLTSTDGGVSVFAGLASTAQGDLLFAVAEPRAAGRLRLARYKEQEWLLDVVGRHGGPAARSCGTPVTGPDVGAEVGPPSIAPVQKAGLPAINDTAPAIAAVPEPAETEPGPHPIRVIEPAAEPVPEPAAEPGPEPLPEPSR